MKWLGHFPFWTRLNMSKCDIIHVLAPPWYPPNILILKAVSCIYVHVLQQYWELSISILWEGYISTVNRLLFLLLLYKSCKSFVFVVQKSIFKKWVKLTKIKLDPLGERDLLRSISWRHIMSSFIAKKSIQKSYFLKLYPYMFKTKKWINLEFLKLVI